MARPTKQGIDYFPLDCQWDDKIKMYLLEKEATGLAVLITLWQMIYSNEGYYISNDNDLLLLIKKEINVDVNAINDCINLCFERNIFDGRLHEKYRIITSKAIQKRYFEAAKKKKLVRYNVNYIINGVDVSDNAINSAGNATNEKVKVNVNVKEKVKVNTDAETPFFLDETTEKIKAFYIEHTKISDPNKITHLQPIINFYEHIPEPLTEFDITNSIASAFGSLSKDKGVRVDFLVSNIQAKIILLQEKKLEEKKKKEKALYDNDKQQAEQSTKEEIDEVNLKKIREYKQFYENNAALFTNKEKAELLNLLKERKVMLAGAIIEPKMQDVPL